MQEISYHLLDVFTEVKFGGNQLAIFPDARTIKPSLFQKIARELQLSETVFVLPPNDSETAYSMRIFTPGRELPTAGHPTVGTAYFLALGMKTENSVKLKLQQKAGLIEVEISFLDSVPDLITMKQPLPTFGPVHNDKLEKLAQLLSLEPSDFEELPFQEVSCGNNVLLLPVKTTAALERIRFRMDAWDRLRADMHGAFVYVFTCRKVTDGDVQGRMFAPDVGIPEDPATGSANGPLMCYLLRHGVLKSPVKSLQGYEMGRPSQLYLAGKQDRSGEITEVTVAGKCVYIGKGTLFLDTK